MKKFTTLTMAFVLSLGMTVSAFAAPSDTTFDQVTVTPSEVKELNPDVEIKKVELSATDAKYDADTTIEEQKGAIADAVTNSLSCITSDDVVVKTDDITILTSVEVTIETKDGKMPESGITIPFDLGTIELKATEQLFAVHTTADGSVELIPAYYNATTGKYDVTFKSFSPVTFVKVPYSLEAPYEDDDNDSDALTSAANGNKSPKTGANSVLFAEVLAAISLALAAVCAKRARREF